MSIAITPRDKIIRSKLKLRSQHPFFFGLASYLVPVETDGVKTMAVNNTDNLYFNPDWVKEKDEEDLCVVIVHEILHKILNHTTQKRLKHQLDDVAKDIKVNSILVEQGFTSNIQRLNGLCPINNQITLELEDKDKGNQAILVKEIFLKTNGNVYDQISHVNLTEQDQQKPSGSGKPGLMDDHSKHENKSASEQSQQQRQWNNRMESAAMNCKGDLPDSIKRLISELTEPELDYADYMRDKIEGYMITDFSWSKPSKLFYSLGIYLPGYKRESFKMLWHIDTSGSVSQKQFTKVMSELKGLLDSHDIEVQLVIGDCNLQSSTEVTKSNIDEVIKSDIFKGHGGTSHEFVFEWIENNDWDGNLLISFTDGYSDIESCYEKYNPDFRTLFIWDDSIKKSIEQYGDIIIMKGIA